MRTLIADTHQSQQTKLNDVESALSEHQAEVHIAGLLVHVAPRLMQQVLTTIRLIHPVEIHGHDAARLVLVAEARSANDIVSIIDAVREMSGVYNVALVYQHVESASAMEELVDANITP